MKVTSNTEKTNQKQKKKKCKGITKTERRCLNVPSFFGYCAKHFPQQEKTENDNRQDN